MDFGSQTGKQREFLETIGNTTSDTGSLVDLLKQIHPGQSARVISRDGGFYKVQLLDENRIVEAMLGKSVNEFKSTKIPVANDKVWVEHKKDGSFCTIEYIIDDTNDIELNKRTTENGLEFRFDNMPYNNEDTVMNKIYKTFIDTLGAAFGCKWVPPAVKG